MVRTGTPLFDGREALVAVARDLSQRWQAESRYRLLLESIDVGVILFDREMHVISANPAAYRAIGAEPGQSVQTLLRPGDWKVVDARGRPLSFRDWRIHANRSNLNADARMERRMSIAGPVSERRPPNVPRHVLQHPSGW